MDRISRSRFGLAIAATAWMTACAGRNPVPRPFPTPAERSTAESGQNDALALQTSDAAAALLQTALALVGSPYREGGQTPATGFDCSGFVAWVYAQSGRPVPRTVGAQFAFGQGVSRPSGLHPADLVFFVTESSRVSHVGIALGDGRFIHAPSTRGAVRVESLAASYWSHRYLGARRVLPDEPVPSSTALQSPTR